ncbi:FG-GAP-like repeat-containing protein [Actinacidiphila rubida]|uniref:Repeat domain-containing protein n=1 Tax=Actinacidiphila rubida TaxID=310780 RepID=A0A1H8DFJ6_9ACTN|nr:FG-GAP-like repeat-containing protein [Actinacidiphila rubida]SEN06040.1 Repeat domain-containing protein [Actinacidiphila rubida]
MRIPYRAALVTAAAALGLIATSVAPAHAAATGYARCPSGRFCVFDGQDGQGAMAAYTTPQADLGTWRTRAASVDNRTGSPFFCMYSRTNYRFTDPVHDIRALAVGTGTGENLSRYQDQNSHLAHNLGSVRWAHTARQCLGATDYLPWNSPDTAAAGAPAAFGDLDGDGRPDLLNRTYGGRLYFLRGDGTGTLIGAGWNSMTALTRHGDLNGDGTEDLLARDTGGELWMYPGNGKGWFGARKLIGGGWNTMTAIQAVGDLDGNGTGDLVARDTTGKLWMYPGDGNGRFGPRLLIGTAWNVMRAFAGIGDLGGDGRNDLVVSDSSGKLWLYPGNGKGWFGTRTMIGSGGWGPLTTLRGVGDITGDGRPDLLAAQTQPFGEIHFYAARAGGTLAYSSTNGELDAGDGLF